MSSVSVSLFSFVFCVCSYGWHSVVMTSWSCSYSVHLVGEKYVDLSGVGVSGCLVCFFLVGVLVGCVCRSLLMACMMFMTCRCQSFSFLDVEDDAEDHGAVFLYVGIEDDIPELVDVDGVIGSPADILW